MKDRIAIKVLTLKRIQSKQAVKKCDIKIQLLN